MKSHWVGHTFIPIIWTQLTAVPVAFERNAARVSWAIAKRLAEHRIRKYSWNKWMNVSWTNLLACMENLPSWVVGIPLGMLSFWVLLLVLTTHYHRLTAIVSSSSRCLLRNHKMRLSSNNETVHYKTHTSVHRMTHQWTFRMRIYKGNHPKVKLLTVCICCFMYPLS